MRSLLPLSMSFLAVAILVAVATFAGAQDRPDPLASPEQPADAAPSAVAESSAYVDPLYGFSLAPPKWDEPEVAVPHTAVYFLAPPKNGHSANVTVVVQPMDTTVQEYARQSVREVQQLGLRLVSEKGLKVSGRDAVLFEYQGQMQGQSLHWLSLAVIDEGRVFLLTGTAMAAEWANVHDAFKASFDSFSLPERAEENEGANEQEDEGADASGE